MKTKVFIVGLDGATWNLLSPWMQNGYLPFLSSIAEKSATGVLQSTIPPISGTAWSSFQTGVNPGKHGIFNFFKRRDKSDNPNLIQSTDIKAKKMWQYFDEVGLKSLMVNMPISYPLSPVNGVIISSFLSPPGGTYVYPSKLKPLLEQLDYRVDIQYHGQWGALPHRKLTAKEKKSLLNEVIKVSEIRSNTFIELTKTQDFDYHFLYYKGTDFIQHLFYDDQHSLAYWQALDELLEKVYSHCTNLGGEQYWFFISDHGFHKTANIQFNAGLWLEKILSDSKPISIPEISFQMLRRINKVLKKAGINLTHEKSAKNLRQTLIDKVEIQSKNKTMLATIEGVYLFDKARTKENIDKIITAAKKVKYGKKSVFSYVAPSSDSYAGSHVLSGPDVVWIFNQEFINNPLNLSNKLFEPRHTHIKGEHNSDRDGILLVRGNNIPKVHLDAQIEDILPSVMSLFGIPVPNFLDGKPLSVIPPKKRLEKDILFPEVEGISI